MIELEIPDTDAVVLKAYLEGDSNADERRVLESLKGAMPAGSIRALAASLSLDVPADKVARIVGVYVRLGASAGHYGSDEEFRREILASLELDGDAHDGRLKELLDTIMACQALELTGKSLALQSDHLNTFFSAKTLSEVRPVFSEEPFAVRSLVVAHQLKLTYHTGPEHELGVVYVAMTRDDLVTMKEAIERALKKDDALGSLTKRMLDDGPTPAAASPH